MPLKMINILATNGTRGGVKKFAAYVDIYQFISKIEAVLYVPEFT